MIYVGKEEFTEKALQKYLCGDDTLTGNQIRAIVGNYEKKIIKGQMNDAFDKQTKQIMESLGFKQDGGGWLVHAGEAKASAGNRAIVAENESAALKSENLKLAEEVSALRKEADSERVQKDKLLVEITKYKKETKVKFKPSKRVKTQ